MLIDLPLANSFLPLLKICCRHLSSKKQQFVVAACSRIGYRSLKMRICSTKLKKTFKLPCQQHVLKTTWSNCRRLSYTEKKDFLYMFRRGQTADLVPCSASSLLSVILFLSNTLDPGKEKAIVQVNFSGYTACSLLTSRGTRGTFPATWLHTRFPIETKWGQTPLQDVHFSGCAIGVYMDPGVTGDIASHLPHTGSNA